MLCVVGDLVEDVIVHASALRERGTDTAARIQRARGGSGANVAAAAVTAGCPSRFIGRVGDDALADVLVESLVDDEVDVLVQRATGRTGAVVVLVEPDGERTMLADRAVAAELGPVDRAWLDGVTWLHIPAYSLCVEPIGTSTRDVVGHVRGCWGRLSVDVSSVSVVRHYGVERFRAMLTELAPDIVFATEDEAVLVAGVALALVVVKHGGEPVELVHRDGRRELVPVEPVAQVIDSTGAGDAFAGGFLASTIGGAAPSDAARAGSALAATVLCRLGAGVASE